MPSLPITLAFQRDLAVILPVLAIALCATPQHADKSSSVDAIFLLHRSATVKTLNRIRFVVLTHQKLRYRTYVR